MINFDKNFIKNYFNFLDKQSVEIIKQNLENYDEWILKNYKTHESLKEFKKYKVKEIKPKTLITMGGKIIFKRRKLYKINTETGKEEYIFLLDKLLEIEKWQRIDNSVKEKILSFIGKKKTYQDILDTMEYVKLCIKTVSNIMKNAKTNKEYYFNKTDKKIKIPHTLYIQVDGTYLKMWNENKKGKEKIKKHSIFSTVHTGFDKTKSTKKRPVIANKLGVIELDNIPEYIKKNSKLTNFVNKLLILITSYYDINDNIEIMVLGDGAPWIKNIAKLIQEYFPKNKVHYTIDKFHLTSRFKKLYPYQSKNKQNKETYHKAVDYFFNAKYEELLECLENSTSFIKEVKMKFLKEIIRLIKNNEEGVRNQTLWNNIGCHIEGDISHYCKGVLVKKATYHGKTLKNKLNTSMINFKNKINLFNTNEPLEENRINYSVNNFVNNNLQPNLYFY
ncbi:Mbov_0401 family ICE element transposase-like protein [Spiroplasma endosymbiont of Polydrusus cervinus]|uniref:Mbov_0401 family ICE element transposase-like protein n=1 Tax=Spiroplasma endosymbiont of Polydrusus cervinus TaxID=3066287 RepID=UPI0030CF607D